jgi:choline dehydrogenase
LANRLSEDPNVKVALLEAGPKDNSLLIRMPVGAGKLIPTKSAQNWGFWTAPQKHLDNRKLWWPRGRGWGGSSSINGMIYIRGHARDYDQWRQMGLAGWGFADVLPYFRRAEHREAGADAFHGQGGPLWVSEAEPHPLFDAFVEAGREAGFPVTKDFNGAQQEGVGKYQLTIKDGERWSASFAYLRPILARSNLTILSNAHTTRLVFDKGRAVGVAYANKRGGEEQIVRAGREVLVCAGAVQSPQILMLSGIGDPEHLMSHGIPVVASSRDVGRNMQDHLDVCVINKGLQPIGAYSAQKGLGALMVGMNYIFRKQGPGRYNFLESGAFLKTRGELDRPDIQLHLVNAIMIDHGNFKPTEDGLTIHACQLRPESKGTISLANNDAFADPVIDPNYLASEVDRRTMRDCVRISRDIMRQKAMAPFRGAEIRPGADLNTDSEIDDFVRRTAETIYHPVGTCRMGADDKSVVDAQLRVRGVEGLRVIDASVMPTLIGGNTNAPTIMIAEKAADMLRGKAAPAAEDVRVVEDAV